MDGVENVWNPNLATCLVTLSVERARKLLCWLFRSKGLILGSSRKNHQLKLWSFQKCHLKVAKFQISYAFSQIVNPRKLQVVTFEQSGFPPKSVFVEMQIAGGVEHSGKSLVIVSRLIMITDW